MTATVVGIDPGLTGGIAVISGATSTVVIEAMPVAAHEVDFVRLAFVLRSLNAEQNAHVFLERAQAFSKMGIVSAFNYGASYWGIRAICATLKIPYTLVAPAKWHRALIVGKDGSPKDRALRTCLQLFPDVDLIIGKGKKCHEGVVDALLVAEFGRRVLNGAL